MAGPSEPELHAAKRARRALSSASRPRGESARALAQSLPPAAVLGLLRGRRATSPVSPAAQGIDEAATSSSTGPRGR
jgi:hypothetical protein